METQKKLCFNIRAIIYAKKILSKKTTILFQQIVPNIHHIILNKYGFTMFFLTLDIMCALVCWKTFIIP